MTKSVPKCVNLVDKCNAARDTAACAIAFQVCNRDLTQPYYSSGLNPYDIRKQCGDNPLCYDFSNVEKWLNSDDTRSRLHVKPESSDWASCNYDINGDFSRDFMQSYNDLVSEMLDAGINVMIYAGDVDFICNYLGNRAWTLELEWSGKTGFNDAPEKEWGDGHGKMRSYEGFTFLQVYDAGHMVPADKPKAALRMFDEFTRGGKFTAIA